MYICVAIYFHFSDNCPSCRFLRDNYDNHYIPVFHGSPTRWNLSTQDVSSSVTQSWFVFLIVCLSFPTLLQGISFKQSSQYVPLWFFVQATQNKIRYENPCGLGSFCCCDKRHSGQKQHHGGTGLFQLTGYSQWLREVTAGIWSWDHGVWLQERVSPGYGMAAAHMNTRCLWSHAQNLCKPQPDQIPAWRAELGTPCCGAIGNHELLRTKGSVFSVNVAPGESAVI